MSHRRAIDYLAMRECLVSGGAVLVWCGLGAGRELAAKDVRRESVRLLAELRMDALYVSRSACDGLSAVALCATQPIGVDVEAEGSADVDSPWLHPRELDARSLAVATPIAALSVWVRKEAVLKAIGTGLVLKPCAFEAGLECFTWTDVRLGRYGMAQVCSVATPVAGIVAAVAVQNMCRPQVQIFERTVFHQGVPR